jgi:hypothetical protein
VTTTPNPAHVALSEAITSLQRFGGDDLTQTLKQIESSLRGATSHNCEVALAACGARADVLGAAGVVKRLAGQINVIVHALGILLCLPHILEPEERIEYVSLGAGNTGRPFDLQTSLRIAEFKFIRWQGGAEAIRQNSLFKDFYGMAEQVTEKRKFLYVLGAEYPLKFLKGGRALASVLSHNVKLQKQFLERFQDRYRTVSEYYVPRKDDVVIQDVSRFVPELIGVVAGAEDGLI